jgi:hypothetical protein
MSRWVVTLLAWMTGGTWSESWLDRWYKRFLSMRIDALNLP